MSFDDVFLGQDVLLFFFIGPPVVDHVDSSGEANILRKQEAMFRLRIVFLFTSIEKCYGDGYISSINGSFVLGYIEVG